jgi:hypothetical protein
MPGRLGLDREGDEFVRRDRRGGRLLRLLDLVEPVVEDLDRLRAAVTLPGCGIQQLDWSACHDDGQTDQVAAEENGPLELGQA